MHLKTAKLHIFYISHSSKSSNSLVFKQESALVDRRASNLPASMAGVMLIQTTSLNSHLQRAQVSDDELDPRSCPTPTCVLAPAYLALLHC